MANDTPTTVYSPNGDLGTIPSSQVTAAIAQGYKPKDAYVEAIHPTTGETGLIPKEQWTDAQGQGFVMSPREQGLQRSQSLGQQIMTSAAGANERGQTSAQRQARRDFGRKVLTGGIDTLPAVGTVLGGVLAAPSAAVSGPAGPIVGAGLGSMAGLSAQRGLRAMMGQQEPSPFSAQGATDLAVAGAQGATAEMGGQLLGAGIGGVSKAVGGAISRMAGVPEATSKAMEEYTSDVAEQQEAIRQRAIGKRQNVATYEEAKTELAESNAQKKVQYQADLGNAIQRIPPAAPGQQELWVDLNKSIQASPAKVRVQLGAPDLDSAVTMPGRGLAQEGLKAADLAKMSPIEQNAAIAPKWNAAGRAVDAAAAKATEAKIPVNLYSVDETVNSLADPVDRKSVRTVINRVGKSLGIRDWGNVTPTQALQLRRELFDAGPNGEYVSRAVSKQLREAVPSMKDLDQHYSDLNAAMTTVRDNLKRFATGKFKLPNMNPDLPEPPQMSEFTHPGYRNLAKIPPTPQAPDLQAIQDELMRKFGGKVAKGALGAAGTGVAGGAAYELYQALRAQGSTPQGR